MTKNATAPQAEEAGQLSQDEMLASISKGDTVITAGGFFGIVREILDDSYLIELDEGVKARILKSSISMKKGEGSTAPQQPKKKKGKKNEQQAQETKPEEELPAETEAQPAETPAEEKPAEAEPQPAEEAPAEEKPRPQVGAGFEK